MKDLAINVLSGPLLMVATCLLGMPCGYELGLIPGGVLIACVAITLAVLLGRFTDDATLPMLAAACAIITGIMAAHAMHLIREMETGAFVRNVAFADLPKLLGKDRLTLGDGQRREDLGEVLTITEKSSVGSDSRIYTSTCHVYPIVASGWTHDRPVTVWRYGEITESMSLPLRAEVFKPHTEAPTGDVCAKTLARAIAEHHLTQAANPIYLEYTLESADADDNKLGVWFGTALMSSLWIGIALYIAARDAITELWNRRRGQHGKQ